MTIKQRVEEAKKEIKEDIAFQVASIRSDIHNIQSIENRFTIGYPLPLPDSQLPNLEANIRPILDKFAKEMGLSTKPGPIGDLIPSESIVFAFSSRYQIEREITRIWSQRFQDVRERFARPVTRMVLDLVEAQLIPPEVGRTIREVWSVCSPIIHGVEATEERIQFLRDIVPSLVATLRSVQ